MPQFSTNEAISLEKKLDLKSNITQTATAEIDTVYEVQRCAEWIKQNSFQRVCLQFPDHLLPDSSEVALKLQNLLGQTVYILGDTAYESCCIDYIAAAHINADAIIHFGPICFSKTAANIPYLNVYEKHLIDMGNLKKALIDCINEEGMILILDDGYIHLYEDACKAFEDQATIELHKIDEDLIHLVDKVLVFIGNNERKLMNIYLNLKPKSLHYFDPHKNTPVLSMFEANAKVLKRRYFLMEKIKDANTIGIVIGTLAVKNYLKVIKRVKKLAELCGKKYYLISVGKPTVAKLANLGEIDVYVMITCSMNEIYDSRDFYKPIVTPYDVEIALNNHTTDLFQFTYDYNNYLNNLDDIDTSRVVKNETDVSLLTGKLRSNVPLDTGEKEVNEVGSVVALKNEGTLTLNSNFGAGFLQDKSWKGLEQNLGQTEVKVAEEGRKGIAQGYENENI